MFHTTAITLVTVILYVISYFLSITCVVSGFRDIFKDRDELIGTIKIVAYTGILFFITYSFLLGFFSCGFTGPCPALSQAMDLFALFMVGFLFVVTLIYMRLWQFMDHYIRK